MRFCLSDIMLTFEDEGLKFALDQLLKAILALYSFLFQPFEVEVKLSAGLLDHGLHLSPHLLLLVLLIVELLLQSCNCLQDAVELDGLGFIGVYDLVFFLGEVSQEHVMHL